MIVIHVMTKLWCVSNGARCAASMRSYDRTQAFQGKRCQPFTMIPLERWNVERSVCLGEYDEGYMGPPSSSSFY
jgi:hypothetical protein